MRERANTVLFLKKNSPRSKKSGVKVIFLDRDGVINEYPGDGRYVTKVAEFKFIPGSIKAIRRFNEAGFKVFIISNQAGIGKGLYSQQALERITQKMIRNLRRRRARVDGVYYCIHREEEACSCRKPNTALLQKALKEHRIRPRVSFFIGDSLRDIETAKRFGIKSVLVLSGREKLTNKNNWSLKPDYIFDNLLSVSHYLCRRF
jgi:D-glycero-D-manno-heptose 1,7-bisphosphate phosphatase